VTWFRDWRHIEWVGIPATKEDPMPISQNGWPANDRSVIRRYTVPGTSVVLALREGNAATVLLYVAAAFNALVEPIDNARGHLDDWGYAERPIRGDHVTLSNHASGTAMDLNATRHPLATSPADNFTPMQIAAIHGILRPLKGIVRWGGDYPGRKDPMHFELVGDPKTVGLTAGRLAEIPTPHPEDDMPLSDNDAEKIAAALLNMNLGRSGPTVGVALQRAAQAANLTIASEEQK
jgi:hypothetical protein